MDSKRFEEESFDPYNPSYTDNRHPYGPPRREPSPFADAPPSYTLSQAAPSSARNVAPGVAAHTISLAPRFPIVTYRPTQAQVLHVYNTGSLFNRQWTVCLPDRSSTVYVLCFPSRLVSASTPTTVYRGCEGGPVAGSAQFRAFSSDVDIAVFPERPSGSGLPVTPVTTLVSSEGRFTRQHSLSLFGRRFWIKGTHQFGGYWSLKFMDERDVVLAVYASAHGRGWDKIGSVEVMVPGLNSAMFDAVVISLLGLADRERERRRRTGALAATVGAGGGGA